jgi:hypothetical protein
MAEKKKRGGRVPGSKNKRTLIGKDVAETLKNWLGFDNESVQRTGMIDGDGYRGRLALKKMWNDERPIDPQYIALAKFLFSYAYGLPTKVVEHKEQRPQLIFASTSGHVPWSPLAPGAAEMNARSQRMIEAKQAELLQQAETREAEAVVIDVKATVEDDAAAAEVLEAVIPPPEPPEAHGRGGR